MSVYGKASQEKQEVTVLPGEGTLCVGQTKEP